MPKLPHLPRPYPIEEDGDEVFTPMPKTCGVWGCTGGEVKPRRGHAGGMWMMCANGHSYGEAPRGSKG